MGARIGELTPLNIIPNMPNMDSSWVGDILRHFPDANSMILLKN